MIVSGTLCVAAMIMAAFSAAADQKPLKVYILAGQSNMQGHAQVEMLKGMAKDPATRPLHDKLVDPDGKPRVFDDVCITYLSQVAFKKPPTELRKHGKLTVDFGGNGYKEGQVVKFGPELAFGATMYESLKEPILIIKTAWGGTSLHTDWYPPGAPPHDNPKAGAMYRLMVRHVNAVLADPAKYHPAYDPRKGHEIAGFVWFQGFNDYVASNVYPDPPDGRGGAYSLHTKLLVQFIKDVRKEFNTPDMPFVIGTLGYKGKNPPDRVTALRRAQAAPADLNEFKGTVAVVDTAPFWDEKLEELENRKRLFRPGDTPPDRFKDVWEKVIALGKEARALNKGPKETLRERRRRQQQIQKELTPLMFSPEELAYQAENRSNAAFHYYGSGKTYSLIGEAFAKAMLGF